MSGIKVRGKLRRGRGRRATAPSVSRQRPAQAAPGHPENRPSVSRAARMLALAHHIERLIDAGELVGYAEAARALGLTRARLTQVMKLLLLSPEIQQLVLLGKLPATERSLRHVVAEMEWPRQIAELPSQEQ